MALSGAEPPAGPSICVRRQPAPGLRSGARGFSLGDFRLHHVVRLRHELLRRVAELPAGAGPPGRNDRPAAYGLNMKATRTIAVLLLIAAAFAGGYVYRAVKSGAAPPAQKGGRKILYWVDPMHPAYKSDKPGIAPDCGMKLE